MQVIDASIKGDIVDAPTDHAAATAGGVAGLDAILYPALLIGPTGLALLAADLATRPALTVPLTLRPRVEGFIHKVVVVIIEAAALAHRHTGATTKHKARVADTAFPAGGFTALGRREAWAADRAGVTAELVVAVVRAFIGCGEHERDEPGRCKGETQREPLSGRPCPGYLGCLGQGVGT